METSGVRDERRHATPLVPWRRARTQDLANTRGRAVDRFFARTFLLAAQTQDWFNSGALATTPVDTLRTGATTIPTLAFRLTGSEPTVGMQGSIALWDLCEHKAAQPFVEPNRSRAENARGAREQPRVRRLALWAWKY